MYISSLFEVLYPKKLKGSVMQKEEIKATSSTLEKDFHRQESFSFFEGG